METMKKETPTVNISPEEEHLRRIHSMFFYKATDSIRERLDFWKRIDPKAKPQIIEEAWEELLYLREWLEKNYPQESIRFTGKSGF